MYRCLGRQGLRGLAAFRCSNICRMYATDNSELKTITEQLNRLEKLTREVKRTIETQDEMPKVDQAPEVTEEDVDDVYDLIKDQKSPSKLVKQLETAKNLDTVQDTQPDSSELLSLFPKVEAYCPLPVSLTALLDSETLSQIADKDTANWVPVIDKLAENPHSLENFDPRELHDLIQSIPRGQRVQVIEKLETLGNNVGLIDSAMLFNDIMATYNLANTSTSAAKVEQLFTEMQKKHIKPNIATMGIMVQLYSKMEDVKKVKEFVDKITELGMQPTPEIYTSVLQMYVRLDKYEHAMDVFDTMKFLSNETAPTSKTYSSVILLDILHDNIEHAVSLYTEMCENEVVPEPQALLALAKGCSKRKDMLSQGWSYVLDYYQNGYPMNYRLMEVMMSLAVNDSDLALARALFLSISDAAGGSASPIPLKLLFNAYSQYDPTHTPVSASDDRVNAIRYRAVEMMNFGPDSPPLLPVNNLNQSLILQECKALFKYYLLRYPAAVSKQILVSYLFVIAKWSTMADFENQLNKYTYFEKSDGQVTVDETPETMQDGSVPVDKALDKPPVQFNRNDYIYSACMNSAFLHKDVDFAQKIWEERGNYRKTPEFQALSPHVQDSADFKFARQMLRIFTETGNVVDAYQMVLSSQNRFVWTYYHLKALMDVCEDMGFYTFKRELMKVVKRGDKFRRRHQGQ